MLNAFFLSAELGQRFCLYHSPDKEPPRGAVVYLHPFAEEMNKSRRMAALQARALAAAGYAVLQIDLHGCGDSSGDFGDASWNGWLDDALRACAWLRQRTAAPLWLWGLRAGCLAAVAAAARIQEPVRFLFWQPVISGKQFLQQFLRLRLAGELLSGKGKGVMEDLRQRIAAGQTVEIAGYALSPGLATGLEHAELAPPPTTERVVWIEVSNQPDASLTPAAQMRIAKWREQCRRVEARVVGGAAFWQTAEIEEVPELLAASLAGVTDGFTA